MNRTPHPILHITAALAWEFWANGWRSIVLAPLGAVALPSLILGVLSGEQGAQPGDVDMAKLTFGFYWMALFILGASVFAALGNPAIRNTLPASSLTLVVVPMACVMLTVFAQYFVVALILNTSFHANWAIWGPGLLAAILIAWCQAVFWTTSRSGATQFLYCLAHCAPLALVVWWWSSADGWSLAGLAEISLGRGLFFGLAAACCCVIGSANFATLRHGAGIDLKRSFAWLDARFRFWQGTRTTLFRSPTSAQVWLEWSERGYLLPDVVTIVGVATTALAGFIPTADLPDFARGIPIFFFGPMFVIGIAWGNRSRLGEFGSFGGSRPLSDRDLANAILKSATLGLICATLISATFMGLFLLIFGQSGDVSHDYRGLMQQLGAGAMLARVALGAVATWSTVSAVTSFALGGNKLFMVAFSLVLGAFLFGALAPLGLRNEYRLTFNLIYFSACLVVLLLFNIVVFFASWRLRLISGRTLWLAAVLILAAFTLRYCGGITREWKYLAPVVGVCTLIPFSLAGAPLAVYVNRHR